MADPNNEPSAPVLDNNGAVTGHIISTTIGGKNGEPKQTISYMAERVVGTGSFGIVFQAKCLESGETVAIKKVLQDRRYKNREMQLMRVLNHPNVISLKHCFFSTTSKDKLFLNLVMEYVPETMYRVLKHYSSASQRMPLIYIKLYTYQIFRGLAYLHNVAGVCHRDLKPQNVLVDPLTHQVKICDFGSAKVLVKGEANISYICSRFYRAPELIFGATEYTNSIDIWSAGCVLAELLLGQPLFPGENAVDQLVEIIKIAEDLKPNPLVTSVLSKLANVIPTWKIVPTNDIIDAAVRDPEKKQEVRSNPYWYTGRPRLKTASELLRVSTDIEKKLIQVTLPFLVLHGGDDRVTDPAISKQLYESASSSDKTFQLYPGMWHALTYGELPENIETVFKDVIGWLDERSHGTNSRLEREIKLQEDNNVSSDKSL